MVLTVQHPIWVYVGFQKDVGVGYLSCRLLALDFTAEAKGLLLYCILLDLGSLGHLLQLP